MLRNLIILSFSMIAVISVEAQEGSGEMSISEEDMPFMLNYSNLDNSFGRVVLSNEKVVLQRLVVPAGKWEGVHSHPGNQLYVHVKGGFWSGKMAGELVYSHDPDLDGATGWMDAIPLEAGHDSGNTGKFPIDLIYTSLKKDGYYGLGPNTKPQEYTDIPLKVVFENHRVIAQRFYLEPGEWTGKHERPGNQLYILVKGGEITERRAGKETIIESTSEDGSARWLEAIGADENYEFGNTGDTFIHGVLITLK